MAYNTQKMLEDINGDLIPQYWDVVEQEFKPLTNEPQDMRLTGSNVELIKEWLGQAGSRYLGETNLTGSTTVTPLDVSSYARRGFYVTNNYNKSITIRALAYQKSTSGSFFMAELIPESGGVGGGEMLPAGASKFYTPEEYEKINSVFPGFAVRTFVDSDAEGSYDVLIFGGV